MAEDVGVGLAVVADGDAEDDAEADAEEDAEEDAAADAEDEDEGAGVDVADELGSGVGSAALAIGTMRADTRIPTPTVTPARHIRPTRIGPSSPDEA